jgi:ribosomal protein L29
MAVDERSRRELHERLKEAIDVRTADLFIEHLPPIGATPATKSDIAELRSASKADVAELRSASKADIAELRNANKADIAELRSASKADIAELTYQIERLRSSMLLTLIGVVVALYAATLGAVVALVTLT